MHPLNDDDEKGEGRAERRAQNEKTSDFSF